MKIWKEKRHLVRILRECLVNGIKKIDIEYGADEFCNKDFFAISKTISKFCIRNGLLMTTGYRKDNSIKFFVIEKC